MKTGDLAKYRQALLGAGDMKAPGGDFNANDATAEAIQHIQNMYAGVSQGGAARKALGAAGGAAQAQADQEEANKRLKLQQEKDKQQELKAKLDYINDPDNYKQVIDPKTGGYKYYDPLGNQISIKQYANATNQYMSEILKHSQNSHDREFLQSYEDIQKLGQIFKGGSKDEMDKFLKKNPAIKKEYEDDLKDALGHDPTYGDMVKYFQASYPEYYSRFGQNSSYKKNYDDLSGGDNGFLNALMGFFS